MWWSTSDLLAGIVINQETRDPQVYKVNVKHDSPCAGTGAGLIHSHRENSSGILLTCIHFFSPYMSHFNLWLMLCRTQHIDSGKYVIRWFHLCETLPSALIQTNMTMASLDHKISWTTITNLYVVIDQNVACDVQHLMKICHMSSLLQISDNIKNI